MRPRSFKRVRTQSAGIEAVQDNIQAFVRPIEMDPLVDGETFTGQAITAGTNLVISHGLGRTPTGFLVLWNNANSVVYGISRDSTTITLAASANCTIDVRVI